VTTHDRPEVFSDHLEPEKLPVPETKSEAFELLLWLALADTKKQAPSAETAPL
jgi:hypothetical protein